MSATVAAPRDFGCTVYQIPQVLLGKADVMVGFHLSLWDFAAAILIARESGATFEYVTPEPDLRLHSQKESYQHTFVVGKKELVEKLVPVLRELEND